MIIKNKAWRFFHFLIIVIFVTEILYGIYMVFFVIGGRRWPLFAEAVNTPIEVILKRRLYAIETWIAMTGLGIYVAVTEMLPRLVKKWLLDQGGKYVKINVLPALEKESKKSIDNTDK